MMGGGAFIRLKAGRNRPESSEQAEIRLADLSRILWIGRPSAKKSLAKRASRCKDKVYGDFCRIWLICHNRPICYLNHSFATEIGAVWRRPWQWKDEVSIRFRFYTLEYMKLSVYSLLKRCPIAENGPERLGSSK
jgi:hypothetical protein